MSPNPNPHAGWPLSPLTVGVSLSIAVVLAGAYFSSRPAIKLPDLRSGSPAIARNRTVEIGGIRRPASDVDLHAQPRSGADRLPTERRYPFGKAPALQPDSHASVQSIFSGFHQDPDGTKTQRSPFFAGKKFDADAYQRNPEAYLSIVEPGRVWQPAQPGPGVELIERITGRRQTILQGESVRLQTQVPPHAPVTFTSFDLGAFQNQLPSISVAADEQGIAEAIFTGTSGTIAEVNILAASPVTTGRLDFVVTVEPKAP